jgi:hypothetical protein
MRVQNPGQRLQGLDAQIGFAGGEVFHRAGTYAGNVTCYQRQRLRGSVARVKCLAAAPLWKAKMPAFLVFSDAGGTGRSYHAELSPKNRGRPGESRFFYWDDVPGRRLRSQLLSSEQARERAKAFARAERDKGT